MSFVHLHVHTEYSLLDGFSNIHRLVERAREMGMPGIAITDHGTMFGVIEFYNAATQAGINPIIGLEAYLAARTIREHDPQEDKKSTHLLLLAENDTGYRNLLQIASTAQLEGFYYYPRIDHDVMAQHAQGLICTSGCMSAEVPRLLAQGNVEAADRQLGWYYDVFGADNFFIELQQHAIPELDGVNKQLLELGKRHNARYVATNDVHYIEKSDARLQDIMLCIQTGSLLSDPRRMRMTDDSYYLRSPQEMAALFPETPEAISNTLLINERCKLDLGFKGYHLPHFDVPPGYTADGYLRELCEAGLVRRYGERANDPVVRQRLDYELQVIHKMGFDTYFLIVWDLCRYSREQSIWYNVRGSGNGSIVAYSLDITLVEPLQYGLIFERFLNPGRIDMPDIDLDFRDDCRSEVLEYTAQKYGADRVAQIITFGTLGARAAIRDVGRVKDIPLSEVDRVAKVIPNIPGKPITLREALTDITEFKQLYESEDYLKDLIDTAADMEGVVRNAGTHAAGVVIADKPLVEYMPLHRPTGAAEASPIKTVTQFEMGVMDKLGILKVDFLGLSTLTIMARACELIKNRHGIELTLENIPTDDPETYALLGRGETAGVFQVEGSGMRRWLMQMKPTAIENVIAMVALFRPGPMEVIPAYIRRMHGEEPIEYKHPLLETIFKETYGFAVYQEQLMSAAMQLAGYSPPEADDLRKAIAKKIKDKLLKHKAKFVHGAVEHGIPEETAGEIFDDWEEFARYGFNKSHAADYGIIAVQTGYLKCHYPDEYMTALLSVTQSDTDKVALYVADCRRMGIDVKPPSVSISGWDFTIEDRPEGRSAIRFGLGAVKNVGHGPVDAILEGRSDRPFSDLNDFGHRVDLRTVGKRALESLIKVGAMDTFGPRSAILSILDQILSISASHFRASDAGQMSIFGASTGLSDEITLPKNALEVNRREILEWERELIGLYVSDHPLSPVMDALAQVVTHFSGQLSEAAPGDKVRVAGIVTRVRPHQTKTGKSMGFVSLEDVSGTIELVVFPRTWDQYWEVFEVDNVVLVDGKVDAQSGDPKVLVDSVTTDLKSIVSSPPPVPSSPNFKDPIPRSQSHSLALPPAGIPSEPLSQEDEDWGDMPVPPDNFISDWQASELTPGGFVVERGVISAEAPMPVENSRQLSAVSISGRPPDTKDEQNPETAEKSLTEISIETPQPLIEPEKISIEPSAVSVSETPPNTKDEQNITNGEKSITEISIETPLTTIEPITTVRTKTEISNQLLAVSISGRPPDTKDEQNSTIGEKSPSEVSVEKPQSTIEPITPIPPEVEIPAGDGITISGKAYRSRSWLDQKSADRSGKPPIGTEEHEPDTGEQSARSGEQSISGEVTVEAAAQNGSTTITLLTPPSVADIPVVAGESTIAVPPYILPPTEAYAGQELRMITVILRPGGDKVRDNLRLRQCYGILISYSGHDRFALQIFERTRGYRIEFPNYTTTYCAELVARLGRIVGADNVIVEPLRLH